MEKSTNTRGMIRVAICIALMLGHDMASKAQEGKTNHAHIGIVYPLSTNGKMAPADTNDLSLHLIAGISQQENTCLVAGVSGVVKGDGYGTMVSGVSNHVGGRANGVQVAGVLNQIKQEARGTQIAGLLNITGDAEGFQVAGLVNKSGDANTQVAGLVNIAEHVKGVQLAGLINIAKQSDYPIGLLNIIEDGEMLLGLTVDESGSSLVALRTGGKVLYGILGLGYHIKQAESCYQLEGGIGAHLLSVAAFRLNAELVGTAMTSFVDGIYGKQSLRMLAGYHIAPRIELFAGPTFNHLLFDSDQIDIQSDRYLWKWHGEDMFNGFYLGGILGLQFSL